MKLGSIISSSPGLKSLTMALVLLVILSGCISNQGSQPDSNAPADQSDTVLVNYTARLDNGTIIDSTAGSGMRKLTIGNGEVIVGLEDAIVGMTPGETRNVTIPADSAYGPYREDLIVELNRSQIPPDVSPVAGDALPLRSSDGRAISARVVNVTGSSVTLDLNSPLAGKNLTYEIELVAIVDRN